jgi:MraZ protein
MLDGGERVTTFGPLWEIVGRSGSRMLLTGSFSRSIDEKQRIAIPKRIREELLRGDGDSLYIAPGTDGSLALYTEDIFATLAARLTAASPAEQDVRAFSRLFYSQAQRVEFDTQGRIRIPAELAKLAGLSREAVMLGVFDHLEIWDRQRWENYLAQRQSRYDEIAEAAFRQTAVRP